jgi:hypothetical protein
MACIHFGRTIAQGEVASTVKRQLHCGGKFEFHLFDAYGIGLASLGSIKPQASPNIAILPNGNISTAERSESSFYHNAKCRGPAASPI